MKRLNSNHRLFNWGSNYDSTRRIIRVHVYSIFLRSFSVSSKSEKTENSRLRFLHRSFSVSSGVSPFLRFLRVGVKLGTRVPILGPFSGQTFSEFSGSEKNSPGRRTRSPGRRNKNSQISPFSPESNKGEIKRKACDLNPF